MEKIIEDTKNEYLLIEDCLNKYGFSAEHNYAHFGSLAKKNLKPLFFMHDEGGVMAFFNEKINVFKMISEVIAPENKRKELFLRFLDYCLVEKKAKKVVVELEGNFRKNILNVLGKHGFRVLKTNYILEWPLFCMADFDATLSGKKFKKLRNIYNRYTKDEDIKILSVNEVDKNDLKQLVLKWTKQRKSKDMAGYVYFINQIENGFKGCDSTRVVLIENKPVSLTAGWKIPNSNNYYSAIGIYDYDVKDIGEFSNVDDLINLKKKNYEWVDFGGSDKELLEFKKKFGFSKTYKTYIFSIAKMDS